MKTTYYQDGGGNQDWERKAMGCTKAELFEANPTSIAINGKRRGLLMLAMSILSDVQDGDELGLTDKEKRRRLINRAKCCLIELDKELDREEVRGSES